jgi:hypothetical protein
MERRMTTDSDLEMVLALNRDYVRSVQTSDVRRFDGAASRGLPLQ